MMWKVTWAILQRIPGPLKKADPLKRGSVATGRNGWGCGERIAFQRPQREKFGLCDGANPLGKVPQRPLGGVGGMQRSRGEVGNRDIVGSD